LNNVLKVMGMKEMLKLHEEEEIDRIHMNENYEVQAWCEMFEVSVIDLKQAVQVVGPSAIKVKRYLEKRQKVNSQGAQAQHRAR
jgi:hypothetical protein